MSNPLSDLIAEKGVLLADGATGTNLFAMGLMSGDAPELWNVDHPERITKLHQDFVDAGSDIILTNSFGGTRHRLKLHGAQDRVFELNKRAAEIARAVADKAPRKVIVAGSVGPTGELLIPLGALSFEGAVEAFKEQIEGLKAGGADIAWIETMSSPDEIRAAAEAAIAAGMPYTFTASFDTAGKTMMGLSPKDIFGVVANEPEQPVALGANCGVGAPDILSSLLDMSGANPDATLIVKGNCGIPKFKGDEIVYSGTPELMAEYVHLAIDAGAKIIGGCCGTSCDHLKAMREALDHHQKGARPTLDDVVAKVGPLKNRAADTPGAGSARRERRGGRRRG
ncbi:betaine--homocysteine S-methyltransferase [Oricola thermophila]|uniref:Betaine--homocysteine S-methyltransferase n=1 Tax=Oricola thermophila TaxID=2742145 RepID=A0A6N1V8S4_9HYPH|nr:betaine--homocysteine S-methyltransferase [Oricola thermophila]QKV17381.1 betaine--homocysteine S-methyltransferase [Oricola thermophila]